MARMKCVDAANVLSDLEDHEERFTPWERGFFESISETIEKAEITYLSENQTSSLEKMRDKYIR